jgi:hypothetical protein
MVPFARGKAALLILVIGMTASGSAAAAGSSMSARMDRVASLYAEKDGFTGSVLAEGISPGRHMAVRQMTGIF